jgi:thiamine-phosphate pyrophosphorylase
VCPRTNPQRSPKRALLCYVTDRDTLAADQNARALDLLLQKIDEVISAGVDWVQIREKDLSAKDLSRLVREALRRAAKHSVGPERPRILVNDRLDVALAEGAGGVHLTGNSLAVADAKELVGSLASAHTKRAASPVTAPNDFLLGVSCHSRQEAEAAAAYGADYIFFGPVFTTPSKAAFGAPQGLDRLAEVCATARIPVLAIGGITLANAASCLTAGAAGIAAIRLFQNAGDPASVVSALQRVPS